jgi:hypothetical protein
MSTSHGSVEGLALNGMGPGLRPDIHVNSFYGGKEHGRCVQLTLYNEFVQLDERAVMQLAAKLGMAAGAEVQVRVRRPRGLREFVRRFRQMH